jgi:transposase
MALELSGRQWKLAFATQATDRPRVRTLGAATAVRQLPEELARAKRHFELPAGARVVSGYEVGYDAFWVHRVLVGLGVENLVMDAASIEVPRRARRAKSDGLDVGSLLRLLLRYVGGDRKALAVVQVPTPAQEDARQLHRGLGTLTQERTRLRNRLRALLAAQGVRPVTLGPRFLEAVETVRRADGQPLLPGLRARLRQEWTLLTTVETQIAALEATRHEAVVAPAPPDAQVAEVQQLLRLRGVGPTSAWLLVMEGLGWRGFRNRREVGAFVGLAPTPYQSGDTAREQGISKAGNARMRALLVDLSWGWLRYQPQSALAQWFHARFGGAGGRARRIGIVAVARKLVIALWRFLTQGVLPEGAVLKPTRP